MSLRLHTLLFTGGVALILLLALSLSSRLAVLRGFEDVEAEMVRVNVQRVHNELDDVLEHIRSIGGDWGPWDDTHAFVTGGNPDYVRDNLSDETVANLNLDFMVFVDAAGRLVHAKYLEMEGGRQFDAPMPLGWLAALLSHRDLVFHGSVGDYRVGIVDAGDRPLMVASYPISRSNAVGPAVGALICGRRLDDALVARVADSLHLEVRLHRQTDPVPSGPALPLGLHGRVWLRNHQETHVDALSEIPDLDGGRAAWLEVRMDRRIYRQGVATWRYYVVYLALLGVAFLVGLLVFLERKVLVRLARVHAAVREIAHSGDTSRRIPQDRRDELGELAGEVNGMLATLEETHARQLAAEARYRAVVDSQTELICRSDREGRLTFVNGAFARALGEPPEALLGRALESLSVDVSSWGLEEVRAALRRGDQVTLENRLILPGGERFQQWTHRAIRDAQGRLVECQSVGHDITERRRAEAALRRSREDLRALLDSIHCGILVVDAATQTIIDLNSATAQLVGRPREEILGQACSRFICPAERDGRPVRHPGQTLDVSERGLLRADGSQIPILKSMTPVERDGRRLLIESFVDLRPLKRVEAELRASEKRYREFFEQDLTGDFITTPDGRILECNPALARMLGYESVEEVKKLNITAVYSRPEDRKRMLEALQASGRLEGHRSELRNREGQPIHLVGNIIGHFDGDGRLNALQGYLYDETQRIHLERNLRQAQKMEALGTLAGGIAHDFNNILAAVLGFAELALLGLDDRQAVASSLENILRAGRRASDLVKQILTYSRRSDQELRPLRMDQIVEEALKLLRPSLPSSIEIVAHLDAGAGCVLADATQVHQVVMNLCTNAAHAMRAAGGRLEIRLARAPSPPESLRRPGLLPAGRYLGLTVSDTGHGIPSTMLDRIFDPYFTTKEKGEGTGMGLSVVQGIVRSYGGLVTVESTLGRGSTFSVYLPLAEEIAAEAPLYEQSLARGCNERILVVDDEPLVADAVRQMLSRLGYSVTVCVRSPEALEFFQRNPDGVDLLITDQTMPHLPGERLAAEMLRVRPDLPVIICSGFSPHLKEVTARAVGLRAFLSKPVPALELASTVRRMLDHKIGIGCRGASEASVSDGIPLLEPLRCRPEARG